MAKAGDGTWSMMLVQLLSYQAFCHCSQRSDQNMCIVVGNAAIQAGRKSDQREKGRERERERESSL